MAWWYCLCTVAYHKTTYTLTFILDSRICVIVFSVNVQSIMFYYDSRLWLVSYVLLWFTSRCWTVLFGCSMSGSSSTYRRTSNSQWPCSSRVRLTFSYPIVDRNHSRHRSCSCKWHGWWGLTMYTTTTATVIHACYTHSLVIEIDQPSNNRNDELISQLLYAQCITL